MDGDGTRFHDRRAAERRCRRRTEGGEPGLLGWMAATTQVKQGPTPINMKERELRSNDGGGPPWRIP